MSSNNINNGNETERNPSPGTNNFDYRMNAMGGSRVYYRDGVLPGRLGDLLLAAEALAELSRSRPPSIPVQPALTVKQEPVVYQTPNIDPMFNGNPYQPPPTVQTATATSTNGTNALYTVTLIGGDDYFGCEAQDIPFPFHHYIEEVEVTTTTTETDSDREPEPGPSTELPQPQLPNGVKQIGEEDEDESDSESDMEYVPESPMPINNAPLSPQIILPVTCNDNGYEQMQFFRSDFEDESLINNIKLNYLV